MSKRTKKDIKSTATSEGLIGEDISRKQAESPVQSAAADKPATAKKRATRKTSKTTVLETAVLKRTALLDAGSQDDPELEALLVQVDDMLTEMTQSKWLSSDWPSLEIDFGSQNK